MEQSLNTRSKCCRGFSLVEALIAVALIGVIAAVAMPNLGGFHKSVQKAKLQTDVDVINGAIDVYVANGGDLSGATSPQVIIDRLKTERTSASAARFVGLTGSTIDHRLASRLASASDAGDYRAVWNSTSKQFEIEVGSEAKQEFYLNESFAEKDYGTEQRADSSFDYNTNPGWIWAYNDKLPTGPGVSLTTVTVATVPSSPLPSPKSPPSILRAPVITPGGGIFRANEYPKAVTLTNPNDASTWLMVSINGGAFSIYSSPITIGANSSVRAYATGDPKSWVNSSTASAYFQQAAPELLASPNIQLSAPDFEDGIDEIAITISNPNAPGTSDLHYAIVQTGTPFPAQSSWALYTGAFSAAAGAYPDGFVVHSYAKSKDPLMYLDSNVAERAAGAYFVFDDPSSKEVLYVIDVSGSMNQIVAGSTLSRLRVVLDALSDAISRLPSTAKFSVATFGNSLEWTDGSGILKDATSANKQTMIDQLALITVATGGGTNYEAALKI
ncbi:MAG: VWA domain-containing protein, partial [Verrucomicrobiae bacterium]|nr:VWA domain-containing protein [Verrucomicrobiae bacterium]